MKVVNGLIKGLHNTLTIFSVIPSSQNIFGVFDKGSVLVNLSMGQAMKENGTMI